MDRREKEKTDYQVLASGALRKQVPHPLDPRKKVSITRATPSELYAEVEIYRRLRQDLGSGLITREDVKRRLATRERGGRGVSVRSIWESYLAGCEPRRRAALRTHWATNFEKCFGSLLAEDLQERQWEEWQEWMSSRALKRGARTVRGAARSTIVTLYRLMRAAYQRAIDRREIPGGLPWHKWKPSGKHGRATGERPAMRSVAEVALVLDAARAHDERRRRAGYFSDACMRLAVMLLCGLRQGEVGGLRWANLRPGQGGDLVLVVESQVRRGWRDEHPDWTRPLDTPKWATVSKPVVVHPDCARLLEEHRTYLRSVEKYDPNGPIFPTVDGSFRSDPRAVSSKTLRAILGDSGVEVDVRAFSAHCLRHTFATLEAAHSRNLKDTAERTRHSSPLSLMTYLHRSGMGVPRPALPAVSVAAPSAVQVLPAATVALEELRHVFEGEDDVHPGDEGHAVRAEAEAGEAAKAGAFEAAYTEWIEEGRRGPRPRAVTRAIEAARSAAYMAAQRRGADLDACRRAGRFAARGFRGAWAKWLRGKEGAPSSVEAGPAIVRVVPSGGAAVVPVVRGKLAKSRGK